MKKLPQLAILLLVATVFAADRSEQDWTHFVRIGAYGLRGDNAGEIVRSAQEDGVFGIEVDNDIEGRYESFLHPEEKLKAIRAVAADAHAAGNHAFVYIAGTECITANADKSSHTVYKDHPDWVQRKMTGEPALFGGNAAFWIKKGDEDVWITPFAREWRKIYMERVRQIAETGIDGIYVDVPYWMTHFDGWEHTWASFDNYTVDAFREKTGLDARKIKLGDFSDPGFQKWVDFRMQAITDFVQEIDRTAKSVNPAIKTIPEIYPGIESEVPVVGADVYSLYPIVDAIAHEYEFGSGEHMAASRTPLDWFCYQVGMHSFQAFAEGKPTWILNYSWDGDKEVDKRESMMNLAASEAMAGANFWDAPGHSMAGSNDPPTRRKIFSWIKVHEQTLYSPRVPIAPLGVYFSPATRNFFADDFVASYRGVLILLMQKHLEFQIVTPRTLAEFQGGTLVLPDVRIIGKEEKDSLAKFVNSGKTLIITGEDAVGLSGVNLIRFSKCPGKEYMESLERDFEGTKPDRENEFLQSLKLQTKVSVIGSPILATSIAQVNGKPHVFLANFAGLRAREIPVQTPQTGVEITISGPNTGHGVFLPFLGDAETINGEATSAGRTFRLPKIDKAAVFWYEP